jgi:hypothetical protein
VQGGINLRQQVGQALLRVPQPFFVVRQRIHQGLETVFLWRRDDQTLQPPADVLQKAGALIVLALDLALIRQGLLQMALHKLSRRAADLQLRRPPGLHDDAVVVRAVLHDGPAGADQLLFGRRQAHAA